jgi:hypothetical protein
MQTKHKPNDRVIYTDEFGRRFPARIISIQGEIAHVIFSDGDDGWDSLDRLAAFDDDAWRVGSDGRLYRH